MVKIITENAEKIEVDQLYKAFIIKTRALGLDCSFTYRVTEADVTLDTYTGTSTHAIVPKFVTIIGKDAFNNKNIENVSLNDGLKLIRTRAFAHNSIREIDIPKTVIMIKHMAFLNNKELFKHEIGSDATLDKEKFRVYTDDIIMYDQA